jgi:hypothetical protein
MKSNALSISVILAALLAVVILPVSTIAAANAVAAVGILAVFVADYGRTIKPLGLRAEVIPFVSAPSARNRSCAAA